jgi:hypothetical protein
VEDRPIQLFGRMKGVSGGRNVHGVSDNGLDHAISGLVTTSVFFQNGAAYFGRAGRRFPSRSAPVTGGRHVWR